MALTFAKGVDDQHPAVYGVAHNRQCGVGSIISRRQRAHWKIDAANAPVSAPDRFSSRHAIDALNRNGR
jgi:hypothetical protein